MNEQIPADYSEGLTVNDPGTTDETSFHGDVEQDISETLSEGMYHEEIRPHELQVQIIDISHGVREAAHEHADMQLAERMSGGGFRGFLKRTWYSSIAREYTHLRAVTDGVERITEEQDLYAVNPEIENSREHKATAAALTERFTADFDEAVHEQAGEKNTNIELENTESGQEIKAAVHELVTDYAEGRIDEDAFNEERTRVLQNLSNNNPELMGEGLLYADNLLEIAQTVKAAVEHGQGIEDVMESMRIKVGEARVGARTEVKYSNLETLLNKLQKSRVGSLVNETTLAATVGSVYSAAQWGFRKTAATLTAFGAVSAGAGVFAGLRENKRLKEERMQYARERAHGGKPAESSKRHEKMEEFSYESRSADELKTNIHDSLANLESDPSHENLSHAQESLAEAAARIELSDRERLDLIHYNSKEELEQQRFDLDIAVATAKCQLREAMQARGFIENGEAIHDFDTWLNTKINGVMELMGEDISRKDELFSKARRREVANAAVKGVAIGATVGVAMQEVMGAFNSDQITLLESMRGDYEVSEEKSPLHETLLARLSGNDYEQFRQSGEMHTLTVGETDITVPEEFSLQSNQDGSYSLVFESGSETEVLTDQLELGEDGSLTEGSLVALEGHGVGVNQEVQTVETIVEQEQEVTGSEFVDNHKEEFTDISRQLWYDNNTPETYDLNELNMHWGGEEGSGINAEGDYEFSVASMSEDGSFHDGLSANWEELAAEGELKVALSASVESQGEVILVDVDPGGVATIEQDSTAARLFTEENGRAVFNGAYAEVSQLVETSDDSEQAVRMLATHIGENTEQFTDTVETTELNENLSYKLSIPEGALETVVDVPPVVPLSARRGLEALTFTKEDVAIHPYYAGYRAELSPQEEARVRQRMSPRLRGNPDAELEPQQEISEYIGNLNPQHRERVQSLAEQLEVPDSSPELVVAIPVAGHQESQNIYRTLEQYTTQTASPEQFELALLVNHPETDSEGNPTSVQETLEEIGRFRGDYPDLRISVLYQPLAREEAKIGRIRKLLSDSILMRSQQQNWSGDFLIAGNDVDTIEVSDYYVENLIEQGDSSERVDGFYGHLDWDYNAFVVYPQVHIGTKYMQLLGLMNRMRSGKVESSGANFAYRASSYAAVGGFDEDAEIGEDVIMGSAIRLARRGALRHEPIKHAGIFKSRVMTSARRAVDSYINHGQAPALQWNGEFTADDELRVEPEPESEPFDYTDTEAVDGLVEQIEAFINQTNEVYFGEDIDNGYVGVESSNRDRTTARQMTATAMKRLGVEFRWENGQVRITDSSQLVDKLKRFQDNYESYFKRSATHAEANYSNPEVADNTSAVPQFHAQVDSLGRRRLYKVVDGKKVPISVSEFEESHEPGFVADLQDYSTQADNPEPRYKKVLQGV